MNAPQQQKTYIELEEMVEELLKKKIDWNDTEEMHQMNKTNRKKKIET